MITGYRATSTPSTLKDAYQQPEVAMDKSTLELALDECVFRARELHEKIAMLERKLDKLCRPNGPTPECTSTPTPNSSTVVHNIRDLSDIIEAAGDRITILIETLDA